MVEEGLFVVDEEGNKSFVLNSNVGAAQASGKKLLPNQSVTFTDQTSGKRTTVSAEDYARKFSEDQAVAVEGQSVVQGLEDDRRRSAMYGGAANQLAAGAAGLARGATFGLSDAALTGLGVAESEDLRGIAQEHSTTSLVGELAGAIAPALFTGGAGVAGSLARSLPSGALAARTSALGARLGGGLRGAVVAGGVEGSVFGAGQAVSRLALADEPLTAEAMFSEIGTGALLGGGLGAAGGALGIGIEVAGAGLAKVSGKVKDSLVKRATPALDVTSKEGKALFRNLKSATDDLDEVIERSIAKAETRSTSGFRFAADDDVAEASFNALRKQKSEALDYAHGASSQLPGNIKKAAARVEAAEQKISSILSNRRGSLDFSKASSLDQKKLGSLSRAFDDYGTSVGKLADETGVPFQAASSPVSSGILPKIEGAGELAKAAREAHTNFRKQLGKEGIDGLTNQTPEQAFATVKALQEATDNASVLAKHVGGKEGDRLARINDDILESIGGATDQKLPQVAELALALGVEEALIPDVDGPADELLKLYLATKMMGKLGGAGKLGDKALTRVAGTLPGGKILKVADGFVSDTIGRMASATGKTMDRVAVGLQKTVKGASKVARHSSPLATKILSEVQFGDAGDGKKPRNKREAFALRSEELATAVANMPATEQKISQRLEGLAQVSPGVAEKVGALTKATVEFLHRKMPKDNGVLQRFGKSRWRPTDGELDKFSRYVRATKDPAGVVERFGDFRMTREDAEVLRELHPAHYRRAQMWIMDHLDELEGKSTFKQRVQMSLFMDTPADPIMAQAATWQSHFEQAQAEGQPRTQGGGGASHEIESAAQQLQKTGY